MANSPIFDPLQDNKSAITLIDSMGNDLSIVNDARASFEKVSTELTDKDTKLIKYLITHKHTSPFRGVVFKFRVKAPLFVCRQWYKHAVASSHLDEQLQWNEKCISGEQEIKSWWGRAYTIKELFAAYQKGKAPYLRSMSSDGTIVKGEINKIWSTGINKVYKVTSALGFTVTTTGNHRFCTSNGYTELNHLSEGDTVMMNGIPVYQDPIWLKQNYIDTNNTLDDVSNLCGASVHTIRKWCRKHNLHLSRKEVSRRSILKHGVFGKGETKATNPKIAERGIKTGNTMQGVPKQFSGSDHWEWKGDLATKNAGHFRARKLVEKKQCLFCDSKSALEIHHVDKNALNNNLENLEVVCRRHHQMRHGKHPLLKAHPVKIKSIEYVGEVETFDIEMLKNHNFVANQFIVHNSLRYVEIDDSGDFYIPNTFRRQSKSNKQGSDGQIPVPLQIDAKQLYIQACEVSYDHYKVLLDYGVCREQARGVLVPSVYTSWVWTVSLQAVLHFIGLRKGEGAQSEIVKYAEAVERLITPIVPETIKIFKEQTTLF